MAGSVQQFNNIYIKNFGDKLDEEALRAMFEKFGVVKSVAVMKDQNGKSRGFGFVSMENHEEAQKAVEALNGSELDGSNEVLYVGRAQKKQERHRFQGVNLYVKNLDDNVTDDELREAFSQYGTITSTKIMTDGERSRGFGFVCFSSPEEATKAVTEMNGRIVGSKPLYVALAQRREDRKAHLSAQYMQRMTTNMGVRTAAPNQMIEQPSQAAGGPGAFYMPFQNQRPPYMSEPFLRLTPRWMYNSNQQFQIGDMRNVVGQGMHPSHTMMQDPVTGMQPFMYTQNVRNPAMRDGMMEETEGDMTI